jgi:hypothetical protein
LVGHCEQSLFLAGFDEMNYCPCCRSFVSGLGERRMGGEGERSQTLQRSVSFFHWWFALSRRKRRPRTLYYMYDEGMTARN